MSESDRDRDCRRPRHGRRPAHGSTGACFGAGRVSSCAGEARDVPIQSIAFPPPETQTQHAPSPTEVDRAVASIRETGGLLHPLTVRPAPASVGATEAFELVCGRLRLEAAKVLGWSLVPCLIVDLEDDAARRVSLIEDACRKTVSQLERAWQIEEVFRDVYVNQKDLAAMISMTPSQVSEARAFAAALPRKDFEAVAEEAGAEVEKLASLSRAALRRLREVPAEERWALVARAARAAADGRRPRLPSDKSTRSTVVLAGGVIRLDRSRLKEVGVLAALGAVLRALLGLLVRAIPGSRMFAALRAAKSQNSEADG